MFKAEASATSAASPPEVWAVLVDVPRWPEWYPGYSAAEADGPLHIGQQGTVTLIDGRHRPFEIFECQEPHYLVLGVRAPGSDIRFRYRVEAQPTSGSSVVLGHTLTGPTSRLFGVLFGRRVAGFLPAAAKQFARLAEMDAGASSST